jgi:hypothetical protein
MKEEERKAIQAREYDIHSRFRHREQPESWIPINSEV